MTRGINDESDADPGFVLCNEARIVSSTDKAVKVQLGRHEHEAFLEWNAELWIPKSAIHANSEVFDPKEFSSAQLIVETWFAKKQGWLDGEDNSTAKKSKRWFGVKPAEKK